LFLSFVRKYERRVASLSAEFERTVANETEV